MWNCGPFEGTIPAFDTESKENNENLSNVNRLPRQESNFGSPELEVREPIQCSLELFICPFRASQLVSGESVEQLLVFILYK
jgi:hypothetical protein